jgi:hypothetical protein
MPDTALEHSRETRHLLTSHIEVTELKLENIKNEATIRHQQVLEGQARIERVLKWAGSLVVSLTLSALAWALVQQINANEAQKRDMAASIKLLEEAQKARLGSTSANQLR